MSSTDRQNNLLISEDWKKIYQSFKNADFQSYDFENLRRTMIDYIRTNFPEDYNDYIESSEYLALIDLIAYIGQSIAFRVDLNARENFLELAERRESVLRLARLISYNAKRNIPASGLLKFNTVTTTENVIDGNGRNLSGQVVTWNDAANTNWYDQFIKVINAALPANQQYGNPVDQSTIYGIPTAQYRFNATNTDLPIYSFSKLVAGRTMNFEVTSTTFKDKTYIYEEAPALGNSIACVYSDDGYGAGSPTTGFFFNFVQGTLNQGTFTVTQPKSNEIVNIDTQNINNSDVWLYKIDQNGLENELWTQVPALTGNNIIYNSLSKSIKNIYNVITRANDAVSLSFSDGTFGNLPLGSFRVYYRTSNGLAYTVNTSDILNVSVDIPYTSRQGQKEVLTIGLNLATSVSNSTPTESNATIKTNAPQTYYTQNRMVTGEDYNISPLSASLQVAKVKAVNRTASGISRYFDLIDPSGKYSSTNLFAEDGILYREPYTYAYNFTFDSQTDLKSIIYNKIYDILNSSELKNYYYSTYIDYLTSSLDIVWNKVTSDTSSSSGYVSSSNTNTIPLKVGSYTSTDLRYITPGALIKFTAPLTESGALQYFDTKRGNALTTTKKLGTSLYIWAMVVSVADNGTAAGTGTLSTGYGPIVLNQPVPSNASAQQIIPKFTTSIESSVVTTMIDLMVENQPFGLRYDADTQSWRIIFESNLDLASPFSLINQGATSNLQVDASWLLAFTTNNEYYTVTSRQLRYVFESDAEISFYYDGDTKIYDSVNSKVVVDTIKVLSVNTTPDGNGSSFMNDLQWQITSTYIGQDGYANPKKVVVSFYDSDNNGIVDNPQLFVDIVVNSNTNEPTYIVEEKIVIADGQEDYTHVSNDPLTGPVVIKDNESGASYIDGTYYYFKSTGVVKQYTSTYGLSPSLDYRVFTGRDELKFQYTHHADYDSRIDPGSSNIIDIYVLTVDYDTQFRQWLSGANVSKPLAPSSNELNSLLSSNLNLIKSISDEIVYHPVNYKLLFGTQADPSLQATFNVTVNPTLSLSSADVTARVLSAIDKFFALENWEFGDTFYFTELATYVMNQLAPDISNFVIVPTQPERYFGSLFEIQCPSNQIFLSCATADNIVVVSGLTSSNLRTVTGPALNNPVITQQITSANFGASN